MRSLVDYLGCGKIYVNVGSVDFIVTKFSDITNKLVPLFEKYPIQGIKYLNWSAHGTATASYRSLLVGQSTRGGSGTPGPAPLQAHASAPSILATSVGAKGQDGAKQESGMDDMGTVR